METNQLLVVPQHNALLIPSILFLFTRSRYYDSTNAFFVYEKNLLAARGFKPAGDEEQIILPETLNMNVISILALLIVHKISKLIE